MSSSTATAENPPPLNIPASTSTVSVSIINTTTRIHGILTAKFMGPPHPGHAFLAAPAFSFLIRHPRLNRSLLFDLGVRKNIETLSPALKNRITNGEYELNVDKDVKDILQEEGIEAASIEAVIWSHWHWDHVGDPTIFPSSTNLIVGPGFKDKMLPGYPSNPDSLFLEADYTGRELVELDPSSTSLRIGNLIAWDYFGDGSFYLLDTPGHAVGHVCGFARVTSQPDSFIFMGGDACHHGGELRPSAYLPLPASITPNPFTSFSTPSHPCPGSLFAPLLHDDDPQKPFYEPDLKGGIHLDVELAVETIRKIQAADCRDNILVAPAHDETLLSVCDFFPKTMDAFMKEGWVSKLRWLFLRDFKEAVGWKGDAEGRADWGAGTGAIQSSEFWKTFAKTQNV